MTDVGIAPIGPTVGPDPTVRTVATDRIGHTVRTGPIGSGPIDHIVRIDRCVQIDRYGPKGRMPARQTHLLNPSLAGGGGSPLPPAGSPRCGNATKAITAYALWMMLCLVAAPGVGYAQEHWQLGVTPSISSGKYGTDTRTDILYTPFTARRLFTDGDLTVVLPYTCIRGSGDVTVVDGTPVRTDQRPHTSGSDTHRQTDNPTADRGDRPGGDRDTTRPTDGFPPTQSGGGDLNTCGVGDVIVRGRYYVLDERGWLPTIAVRAHFKAPTASADDGLGTGRPDEGVGIEVSRTIGGGFMALVDGGYTFIGQPDDAEFNNRWWYSVGAAKSLASGVVNLSVFFEEYRAIVPGYTNARDVLTMLSLKSARGWRVQLLGEFGLSDGAADLGFIVGASRRF